MRTSSRLLVLATLALAPLSLEAQAPGRPAPPPHPSHPAEPARPDHAKRPGHPERPMKPLLPTPGAEPGARMHHPHAERLLALRQRLELTDQQVQRLTAIREELRRRNAPLIEQLRTHLPARGEHSHPRAGAPRPKKDRLLGRPAPGQTPERPALSPEAQRLMEQIRANRQQALEQAKQVLSAEQQQRLRTLMDARNFQHMREQGKARTEARKHPHEKGGERREPRRQERQRHGEQHRHG